MDIEFNIIKITDQDRENKVIEYMKKYNKEVVDSTEVAMVLEVNRLTADRFLRKSDKFTYRNELVNGRFMFNRRLWSLK